MSIQKEIDNVAQSLWQQRQSIGHVPLSLRQKEVERIRSQEQQLALLYEQKRALIAIENSAERTIPKCTIKHCTNKRWFQVKSTTLCRKHYYELVKGGKL